MIRKLVYIIGLKRRNPSLLKTYRFLKDSEKWSLLESKRYQTDKCLELLIFANTHSKFWRGYFQEHKLNVNTFTSLDDLKKIPPISKKVILHNINSIHTDYQFQKVFISETSGTTGEALKFLKNEEWDSFNRASLMRGYSWYGVKPWDRNGYFWGYNFSRNQILKVRLQDWLQNRYRLFTYDSKNIDKFTKRLKKTKYLHGYSSMIYEVAKAINRKSICIDSIKMVKGTSEKLYDSYQLDIEKAFGVKAINEYGAAETGIIGFECPFGHIHINMQGVIVEQENNEIIVTNLESKSFPIIRYRLGDYIEMHDSFKCKCGLETPVIKNIIGRIGKTVYGQSNIYPSLTFYYIFKNMSLNYSIDLNYQVVQNSKGNLEFKIEQSLTNHEKEKLRHEIYKYFGNDMLVLVSDNQVLHKMKGKLKDFISNI